MSTFKNVTIHRAANIYFGGNVTSRKIELADGTVKTLGIMMPGEYTFDTESSELMEITSGELEVKLPNQDNWQVISAGDSFEIPANVKFHLKVKSLVDYCCSYFA